jgi:hypothetical protein
MKSSLIRSGAAAIVAALAFAACAGHGLVPSSSGLPSSTGNAVHVAAAPAAGNPCPIAYGWPFGGSCDPVALATTGAKGKLKGYMGFTLTSTLATNNAAAGTYLVFQDATGKGDIGKYKGKKFPADKNAILYLAALNTGAAFTFNATPAIKITSTKAIPGKACSLDQLSTKLKWGPSGLTGKPKGKTVTFLSLPVPQQVPAGTFYLAFSCK